MTGFEADEVQDTLTGLPTTFAHNSNFAKGQQGSVAAGLAVAPDADLLLIGLADQACLTSGDLADLVKSHQRAEPHKITIPMQGRRRGNPILVPRGMRPRLTSNPDHPGCMRFTRGHPEHVQFALLGAPGFFADVDTPEDYAALTVQEAQL